MNKKRNNWFNNYEKLRDINFRVKFIRKEDIVNKNIIDIGCNTGQMCRYASDLSANEVLGVEFDINAINNARKYSKNYKNITYLCDDIDNYLFYTNLKYFDTCFLLSVIGTVELENRYGILSRISNKIKNALYIEGHHNVFLKKQLLKAILDYTTFTNIEYLGKSFDREELKKNNKHRDIFRCSKYIYNHDNSIKKINNIISENIINNNNVNICFYGHGGVGKTYFRKKLISFLNKNTKYIFDEKLEENKGYFIDKEKNICILDDILKPNVNELKKKFKILIQFDYRTTIYNKDNLIDYLFIFKYDIKKRFKNRNICINNRSLKIEDIFIKNIYHIEKY